MVIFDSHFHFMQYKENLRGQGDLFADSGKSIKGLSCALDPVEFFNMERECDVCGILPTFGIHPLNPEKQMIEFLEKLLKEKRIAAIGEIGFDFYVPESRKNFFRQEEIWNLCINLALNYSIPVIIHNRKALDLMFKYAKELSNLPTVMFHSFSFGYREALSLLDKGINSYFSFGTPLLKGNRKNAECVEMLPLERILLETDAPFQPSKDKIFTNPCDIEKVCSMAASIRKLGSEDFAAIVNKNSWEFLRMSPYLSERDSSSRFMQSIAVL